MRYSCRSVVTRAHARTRGTHSRKPVRAAAETIRCIVTSYNHAPNVGLRARRMGRFGAQRCTRPVGGVGCPRLAGALAVPAAVAALRLRYRGHERALQRVALAAARADSRGLQCGGTFNAPPHDPPAFAQAASAPSPKAAAAQNLKCACGGLMRGKRVQRADPHSPLSRLRTAPADFKIYRWDPEVQGQKPFLATYAVDMNTCVAARHRAAAAASPAVTNAQRRPCPRRAMRLSSVRGHALAPQRTQPCPTPLVKGAARIPRAPLPSRAPFPCASWCSFHPPPPSPYPPHHTTPPPAGAARCCWTC